MRRVLACARARRRPRAGRLDRARGTVPRARACTRVRECGRSIDCAVGSGAGARTTMGLQGKLVLSFMTVLTVALGTSCWLFFTHNRQRLVDVTGEEAKQLSLALALGSEGEVREGSIESLRNAAQELIKSRNVLFVAFLDGDAHVVAFASRDPDSYLQRTALVNTDARDLMQVRRRRSPIFGNYIQVVAPAFRTTPGANGEPGERRLAGYAAVGVSMAGEESQLRRTMLLVTGIGCVMLLLCWPLAYLCVHRIFQPIRELVRATRQITGGD